MTASPKHEISTCERYQNKRNQAHGEHEVNAGLDAGH